MFPLQIEIESAAFCFNYASLQTLQRRTIIRLVTSRERPSRVASTWIMHGCPCWHNLKDASSCKPIEMSTCCSSHFNSVTWMTASSCTCSDESGTISCSIDGWIRVVMCLVNFSLRLVLNRKIEDTRAKYYWQAYLRKQDELFQKTTHFDGVITFYLWYRALLALI